jgi:FlaA1/EpsC-like NDP-sugar epimerase
LFYLGLGILFGILAAFSSFLVILLPIASFLLFLLPVVWLFIQVIFVFKDITLLDTRAGILKNFRVSWKLSAGNRVMIGRNIFFIVFLNMIISMVSVGTHVMLSMFVVSFLEVIVLLIRQRLVALMYLNRTRKQKEEPAED